MCETSNQRFLGTPRQRQWRSVLGISMGKTLNSNLPTPPRRKRTPNFGWGRHKGGGRKVVGSIFVCCDLDTGNRKLSAQTVLIDYRIFTSTFHFYLSLLPFI